MECEMPSSGVRKDSPGSPKKKRLPWTLEEEVLLLKLRGIEKIPYRKLEELHFPAWPLLCTMLFTTAVVIDCLPYIVKIFFSRVICNRMFSHISRLLYIISSSLRPSFQLSWLTEQESENLLWFLLIALRIIQLDPFTTHEMKFIILHKR